MKRAAFMGIVVVAVLAVLLGVGAVWLSAEDEQSFDERLDEIAAEVADLFGYGEDGAPKGSGFLEGHAVIVRSESSGRVHAVEVTRRGIVSAGDVVVVLADDSWAARATHAWAAVEAARIRRDRVLRGPTEADLRVAEAAVAQARAAADAAESAWAAADSVTGEGRRFDPERNETQTRHEMAQAALEAAEARLSLLREGATEPERRLAEAALRRTEAALALINVQQERLRVLAPVAGEVTEVFVVEGSQVTSGSPLVRLVGTDPITLTIYVGEMDLPDVHIGDAVDVTVDAFEDRAFPGRVVSIAAKAEFTPKNVQTAGDRASLVHAVTIEIPNPRDGALKPGMPADAVIRAQ